MIRRQALIGFLVPLLFGPAPLLFAQQDQADAAAPPPAAVEGDAAPGDETAPPADSPADSPAGNDAPAPPGSSDAPAPPGSSDAPAPPGSSDAPAPPGSSDAAVQAYQQTLDEWKGVIAQLRDLREKYAAAADEAAKTELSEQWNEQIAKGNELLPELRSRAVAAYEASPNTDRELTRMLVKMAADLNSQDRYEEADALAGSLLANDAAINQLYNEAGIAAFVTNDYEAAKAQLEKAKSLGVLSEEGQEYLGLVDKYQKLWEREQQLREDEAKQDDLPRVKLATTAGEIVLELFEDQAPNTVANFITLVEKGFYDGLAFHRVIPGFVAQGGDPQGTGSGGPGYTIPCECFEEDARMHFRGSLSMAHAGKDTGGSQFFLTFVPTDHLNGRHTVFGRVIEGMDVLADIQRVSPGGDPSSRTKITAAEVLRKRDHEYTVKKVGETGDEPVSPSDTDPPPPTTGDDPPADDGGNDKDPSGEAVPPSGGEPSDDGSLDADG